MGRRTTIADLRRWKREGRRFSVLTCYDYTTARLQAEAGIDAILVGDTAGEVILGHESTLRVRLDFLLTLTEAVRRGAPEVYLIGDMPFLSYQVSVAEAVVNAGRFVAEAGCDAVKLEVDERHTDVVGALVRAGIPVIAHLGMLPQTVYQHGGYRAQGRDAESAWRLLENARRFESLGVVGLLLEAVPAEVARLVTERSGVPVIGIAAGGGCDGQVVVMHDILGLEVGHAPRSVKRYADAAGLLREAFRRYHEDVVGGRFPDPEHDIRMSAEEWSRLAARLEGRG